MFNLENIKIENNKLMFANFSFGDYVTETRDGSPKKFVRKDVVEINSLIREYLKGYIKQKDVVNKIEKIEYNNENKVIYQIKDIDFIKEINNLLGNNEEYKSLPTDFVNSCFISKYGENVEFSFVTNYGYSVFTSTSYNEDEYKVLDTGSAGLEHWGYPVAYRYSNLSDKENGYLNIPGKKDINMNSPFFVIKIGIK